MPSQETLTSPALAELRKASRAAHDHVDTAFSRFTLSDPASYRQFLLAHAQTVPAVETALVPHTLPAWTPRTRRLTQDLAALDVSMPPPAPFILATQAEAYGALYVLEGSRLGGKLLAARVPDGLPKAYLSAIHQDGEWRNFLLTLSQTLDTQTETYRRNAISGVRKTFALFQSAATS